MGANMKVGDIVCPRWFVPGPWGGLATDTRCVVREVRKRDRRVRVERDDERFTGWSYWLDFDAVRKFGG